jgi:hypothetical protein
MACRLASPTLQCRVSAMARAAYYGLCSAKLTGRTGGCGFTEQATRLRSGSTNCLQSRSTAPVLLARVEDTKGSKEKRINEPFVHKQSIYFDFSSLVSLPGCLDGFGGLLCVDD